MAESLDIDIEVQLPDGGERSRRPTTTACRSPKAPPRTRCARKSRSSRKSLHDLNNSAAEARPERGEEPCSRVQKAECAGKPAAQRAAAPDGDPKAGGAACAARTAANASPLPIAPRRRPRPCAADKEKKRKERLGETQARTAQAAARQPQPRRARNRDRGGPAARDRRDLRPRRWKRWRSS